MLETLRTYLRYTSWPIIMAASELAALGALGPPLLREPVFWWCMASIPVIALARFRRLMAYGIDQLMLQNALQAGLNVLKNAK